jgi:hypothetical protein
MSVDPILLIHRQPDCYVTFHLIRDGDIVNDCAVKLSSLRDVFPEFRGEMERDFYFSLNSFYRPGQQGCGIAGLPRALRKAKTARYLNVFFVDIDCYKLGIESGTMAGHILTMQDHGLIPPISGMIRSGQGLWALWLLVDQPDGTQRPPTAHTHRQILWQAIERALISRFAEFEVDKKVCDVSRIARVPGTINSKSDTRVEFSWFTFDGRTRMYTMEQLASFLGVPVPTRRSTGSDSFFRGGRSVQRRDDAMTMRLRDFLLLRDMRGGHFDQDCRNFAAMIYAYLLRANRYDNRTIASEVTDLAHNCRPPLAANRIRAAIHSGKEMSKIKDATIAAELLVTDGEAKAIPRFWRGGLPPGIKRVVATTFVRRGFILDIARTANRRLSCQDIVTLLAFRGIVASKMTVSRDQKLLFGPRKPAKVTLPLPFSQMLRM